MKISINKCEKKLSFLIRFSSHAYRAPRQGSKAGSKRPGSDGAGNGEDGEAGAGCGGKQGLGGSYEGGAGGAYVIDQENVATGNAIGVAKPENAAYVDGALRAAYAGLTLMPPYGA